MRVKILNDRLLIFCFSAISLLLPPCPVCTFLLSSLYKATQSRTQSTETTSTPPFALHPITVLLWEMFWLICIDCYGPSPHPWCSGAKKTPKKLSFLIHQTSTCQTLSQEDCHKFLFNPPPSLFCFLLDKYCSCDVPNSQKGAVIWFFCPPFSITN